MHGTMNIKFDDKTVTLFSLRHSSWIFIPRVKKLAHQLYLVWRLVWRKKSTISQQFRWAVRTTLSTSNWRGRLMSTLSAKESHRRSHRTVCCHAPDKLRRLMTEVSGLHCLLFACGAAAQSGPWPPHSRGF